MCNARRENNNNTYAVDVCVYIYIYCIILVPHIVSREHAGVRSGCVVGGRRGGVRISRKADEFDRLLSGSGFPGLYSRDLKAGGGGG